MAALATDGGSAELQSRFATTKRRGTVTIGAADQALQLSALADVLVRGHAVEVDLGVRKIAEDRQKSEKKVRGIVKMGHAPMTADDLAPVSATSASEGAGANVEERRVFSRAAILSRVLSAVQRLDREKGGAQAGGGGGGKKKKKKGGGGVS